MRSRIFCCILDVVASAYELAASEILGKSHAEEVVNARILVVHHLSRFGFSDTDIAFRLHRTPQAVRHMKSLYAMQVKTLGELAAESSIPKVIYAMSVNMLAGPKPMRIRQMLGL